LYPIFSAWLIVIHSTIKEVHPNYHPLDRMWTFISKLQELSFFEWIFVYDNFNSNNKWLSTWIFRIYHPKQTGPTRQDMLNAATHIQRYIRGFLVRKRFERLKRKVGRVYSRQSWSLSHSEGGSGLPCTEWINLKTFDLVPRCYKTCVCALYSKSY
jgi:hypothetical protein